MSARPSPKEEDQRDDDVPVEEPSGSVTKERPVRAERALEGAGPHQRPGDALLRPGDTPGRH